MATADMETMSTASHFSNATTMTITSLNQSQTSSQMLTAQKKQQLDRARVDFERTFPELKLIYSTNQHCYYKNSRCRLLDAEIGDISLEISDIELQILEWLQSTFVQSSHIFAETSDVCAELDCLMAFAQVAQENGFVQPILKLGEYDLLDSFIDADYVFHPLAQLNMPRDSSFVPNMVKSGSLSSTSSPGEINENKINVIK